MKKHLIVLMGAAILAISTSGAAYADEANTNPVPTVVLTDVEVATPAVDFTTIVLNNWLNKLDSYTEDVSGERSNLVKEAVNNGETLAEASGLPTGDLIAKLNDLLARDMANEVSTGTITEQEADQIKQQAASRIWDLVTSNNWKERIATVHLHSNGSDIIQQHLYSIVSDVADLTVKKSDDEDSTELNSDDLYNALRDGQSLAEATGRKADYIHALLTNLLNLDLEAAVNAGDLPADRLEHAKEVGANALWDALNEKGYDPETTLWMKKYGESVLKNVLDPQTLAEEAAGYGDKHLSKGDVFAALTSGQNLAKAAGIADSDLSRHLTGIVKEDLESEWKSGHLSLKLTEQLEKIAETRIDNLVRYGLAPTNDFGEDNHVIAQESIQTIFDDIANYKRLSVSDLKDRTSQGKSLIEATGASKEALNNLLDASIDSFLANAVQNGWLKNADEDLTKADAYTLAADAIGAHNYQVPVAPKAFLQERIERIAEDAASVSNVGYNDTLKRLVDGQSLAEAVKTDNDTLLYKLLSKAYQEINGYVAAGTLTADEAAAFKTDYELAVVKELGIN